MAVLAWLLAAVGPGRGAEETPPANPLDGPAIIRLAVERDDALRRQHAPLLHAEEITTEQLNSAGTLLTTRTERRPDAPSGEQHGAAGTLAADRNTAKPAAGAKQESGSFNAAVNLGKLAGRFLLRREPDGAADDGRPCYVVSFRPRPETPASRTREELVMDQLGGRFWLAKDDFAITQSEGALTRPVTVAWVASVYRLSFRYTSWLLPGAGGTVPARFVLDLGVRAPFYHARQRQTTVMHDFR